METYGKLSLHFFNIGKLIKARLDARDTTNTDEREDLATVETFQR